MISKTRKGYRIKFNKEFYSENTLKKALDDFKEVLTGTVKNNMMMINLKVSDEIIPYEFCNYVFSLTK
ncbi:hypothetical protein HN592_05190 [Candidatus Woesearchaeota archaeon]|jgi:hypothetical protein|nr:hypothetical protein [Candidatus Woesearchaeota archaeon]MBT4367780.1 hypothetical protein [Candidatus Woesearchaeota archaeon]MBT4712268.1 hypothetical protein [Candidatus Woesearchaeota archaeon]MBT6638816.1 hypothetical protein [Candidatus Woesearchaeota archaeon]MBT7134460.1 hypothetical protein [Candidatus Woesearchaeota archaeon]